MCTAKTPVVNLTPVVETEDHTIWQILHPSGAGVKIKHRLAGVTVSLKSKL